jgi:hypothetical protein
VGRLGSEEPLGGGMLLFRSCLDLLGFGEKAHGVTVGSPFRCYSFKKGLHDRMISPWFRFHIDSWRDVVDEATRIAYEVHRR